jgi:hypothetical protein
LSCIQLLRHEHIYFSCVFCHTTVHTRNIWRFHVFVRNAVFSSYQPCENGVSIQCFGDCVCIIRCLGEECRSCTHRYAFRCSNTDRWWNKCRCTPAAAPLIISTPMTEAETVPETLDTNSIFTQVIAQEEFIASLLVCNKKFVLSLLLTFWPHFAK